MTGLIFCGKGSRVGILRTWGQQCCDPTKRRETRDPPSGSEWAPRSACATEERLGAGRMPALQRRVIMLGNQERGAIRRGNWGIGRCGRIGSLMTERKSR
jgi:hypothetical protein